jgi:ABC-type multidrug transport system ATPase subunit
MKLQIQNLSKTYPNGVQALKNVSLSIPNGLYGLLGPNGAGKSTLMRTIATLQNVDEGTILFDNLDVLKEKHQVRKILGYLPQEFGVYSNVSAESLLDQIAIMKGITNKDNRKELVKNLLIQTNLADVKNKKLGGFSGGMKQRFGVAQALIGNPRIIIVDEPTAGLDPAERKRSLNILSEIGESKVVILSTHIVDDVKDICSNMAIINKGEVKYQGQPTEAIDSLKGKIWKKQVSKAEADAWNDQYKIISSKLTEGMVDLHIWSEDKLDGFERVNPDLEDVYFSVISGYMSLN